MSAARPVPRSIPTRFRGASVRDVWEQQAQDRAAHPFLIHLDPDTETTTEMTYGEFAEYANRIANAFLERGVTPGDRVLLHQGNTVELVGCLLAAATIGAVVVPIGATATEPERADLIRRSTPTLFVLNEALPPTLPNVDPSRVLVAARATPTNPLPQSTVLFADAVRAASPLPAPGPRPTASHLAEIMFTSGTTAEPKGVMLSHANLVFAGEYVNWELAMTENDRYLTAMLGTHANFQMSALLPAITSGSTLIFARRYSASRYWRHVREQHATLVQGMAMIARTMLLQPVAPDEQQHDVRHMHYFLPISAAEKAAFEKRFRVRILNSYGSTETLAGTITDTVTESNWPSIGRIGPGYQAKIVGPDGNELSTGATGEILIHGVPGLSLAAGYWQEAAATASVFTDDGWFHTGDHGYRDADGWFYFAGRAADHIKIGGQSISAIEVESVLREHPGVADAAVLGVGDPIRDASVAAFIVAEPGIALDADDIRDFCCSRLAAFKIPTRIDFVANLPRGHYGKVRKDQLLPRTRKAA